MVALGYSFRHWMFGDTGTSYENEIDNNTRRISEPPFGYVDPWELWLCLVFMVFSLFLVASGFRLPDGSLEALEFLSFPSVLRLASSSFPC